MAIRYYKADEVDYMWTKKEVRELIEESVDFVKNVTIAIYKLHIDRSRYRIPLDPDFDEGFFTNVVETRLLRNFELTPKQLEVIKRKLATKYIWVVVKLASQQVVVD